MLTKEQVAGTVAHTYISEHVKRKAAERRARIRNTVIVSAAVLFLFAAVLDSVGVF